MFSSFADNSISHTKNQIYSFSIGGRFLKISGYSFMNSAAKQEIIPLGGRVF
jgi:hypothetical protein